MLNERRHKRTNINSSRERRWINSNEGNMLVSIHWHVYSIDVIDNKTVVGGPSSSYYLGRWDVTIIFMKCNYGSYPSKLSIEARTKGNMNSNSEYVWHYNVTAVFNLIREFLDTMLNIVETI